MNKKEQINQLKEEVRYELTKRIIPFWEGLCDKEYGGYYGYLDYDLKLDKKAVKGCILNSRITWFFSNAYMLLKDEELLNQAKHAYTFLRDYCIDKEYGGIYWSMTYDGKPVDTTKHTYNQAFCIYALSSYYDATKDEEALELAYNLVDIIETRCRDNVGYLEAFTRDFGPESNEKLSENGVMAEKTMNTLLHVFEAYTELYRVTGDAKIKDKLIFILDLFADKIYNPERNRQEVFFDKNYNTILDLHSYGHDIETAWLLDRGIEIIKRHEEKTGIKGEHDRLAGKISPITKALTRQIYKVAFNGKSLANECDRGVVNTLRIWWVQAESVVGFLNGYQKNDECEEYLNAFINQWEYIRDFQIDRREGSEWFYQTKEDGAPDSSKPIVEEWKCPYHNGRMCFEVLKRLA